MEKQICPKCGGVLNWVLLLPIDEESWEATYGCMKRCIEATKIIFGEKHA